ncbi:MAG TPA: hypothetical protein VHB48_09510 [Chitinophagaceae bacterium]|jgi:hypothetical protein|nr:hypothetical protein [Chitinophagaceae bacterium]
MEKRRKVSIWFLLLLGVGIGLIIKNVRIGLLLGLIIGLLSISLLAGRRK